MREDRAERSVETLFIWVEQSALSLWIRGETGSTMAFPVIISFHALGMGFLVGSAGVVNLRILGGIARVPAPAMGRFLMPVAVTALTVNAVSGVLLLAGYPTKSLTNPLFYAKLLCIALGLWLLWWHYSRCLVPRSGTAGASAAAARGFAVLSCLLWLGAIGTGRLLAYTYDTLLSI